MRYRVPATAERSIQPAKRWQMRRLLAWLLAGLAVSASLIGLGLEVFNRVTAQSGTFIFANAAAIAIFFPMVGLVIALRQPQNPIGWLFCLIGLGPALSMLGIPYTVYTYRVNPGALPSGPFMSWISQWAFVTGVSLIPLLLLLFPDGKLPSPRWRWVVRALVLGAMLMTLEFARLSWPLRGADLIPYLESGIEIESDGGRIARIMGIIIRPLMFGGFFASIVAMVLRFRRSRGTERQQMKWFTYALGLAVFIQIIIIILQSTDPRNSRDIALIALQTISIIGVAFAVGFAILRYRLYDIDLVINRTLVYTVLTSILAVIYVGLVILLQRIFTPFIEGSEIAIVGSTLVTAALFTPLHHRVQNSIDRRFYRRKYDTRQTLETFNTTVRNEIALEELTDHLLVTVEETMQPTHVSLWLRANDR
jgi:hypothetical protein